MDSVFSVSMSFPQLEFRIVELLVLSKTPSPFGDTENIFLEESEGIGFSINSSVIDKFSNLYSEPSYEQIYYFSELKLAEEFAKNFWDFKRKVVEARIFRFKKNSLLLDSSVYEFLNQKAKDFKGLYSFEFLKEQSLLLKEFQNQNVVSEGSVGIYLT